MAATEELPQFVKHKKFGVGRLIGTDANYAEIMFKDVGRKRFHRDYALGLIVDKPPSDEDQKTLASMCKGLSYLRPGEVAQAQAKEAEKKKKATTRKRSTKKSAKKASAASEEEDE